MVIENQEKIESSIQSTLCAVTDNNARQMADIENLQDSMLDFNTRLERMERKLDDLWTWISSVKKEKK